MAPKSSNPAIDVVAGIDPAVAEYAANDLTAEQFHGSVTALTSAFGDATRREIYLFIRDTAEGATASEVAETFQLHPNVARHHLEKLNGGGYLAAELHRGALNAGRPSKRYRATNRTPQLPVLGRRDDLLAELLVRALEHLDPKTAEQLAEEVGHRYGTDLAAAIEPSQGHRSVRAAVATVVDALTAHGFAAHSEQTGNSLTIVNEHCPFGEAAARYPHVVCAVDRGLIRGMLAGLCGDRDPTFEQRRPLGDAQCVARV